MGTTPPNAPPHQSLRCPRPDAR